MCISSAGEGEMEEGMEEGGGHGGGLRWYR